MAHPDARRCRLIRTHSSITRRKQSVTETPSPGGIPADRPRPFRHRTWIVPLLLTPVLFVSLGVASTIEETGGVPEALVPWMYGIPFFGSIISFIVFVIAVVSGLTRKPGPWKRRAQHDASRRGLTAEEYGVYKGDYGSLVQPVNSAGGLLGISITLSVIGFFVLIGIGILIAQSAGLVPKVEGDTELSPVMWFFVVVFYTSIPWSWSYYAKERRAQKLRVSRGLPRTLR